MMAQGGMQRLQVLRTQPEEGYDDQENCWLFDKSIKHAYFQASSFARNYIYLENQYFFYEEWARHLKANRQAFMDWVQAAGKTSQDARLLHLMAVIPLPESEGMVPRTYDTLKSLGQASAMPDQHQTVSREMDAYNKALKAQQEWDARYRDNPDFRNANANSTGMVYGQPPIPPRPPLPFVKPVTQTAQRVKEPTLNEEGVLMQDGKSLGLKTLICKMVTPNLQGLKVKGVGVGVARDIYIHSKLLLIDDCYMTLGSANLNLRSMAADSEMNVATDSIAHTRDLRKRVWAMQTGGQHDGGSGTPTPVEMADIFAKWQKLAQDNARFIGKSEPSKIQGHLAKFEDTRIAFHRYG